MQAGKILNNRNLQYKMMRIKFLSLLGRILTLTNSFFILRETVYAHLMLPLLDIL